MPASLIARRPALACLLVMLLVWLAGCRGQPKPFQQESYVFGTRVEVLIHGVPEARARAAANQVLGEFDRLHRMLHAWQPSELTRLNAAIARGEPEIPVSAELADLLTHARGLAVDTEGLFDPGIGQLIGLWGFHGDQYMPRLPGPEALQSALRARPGLAQVRIEGLKVSCPNRAVQIDLGGYAKGYALDRAVALLKAAGVDNALINIGGNLMALGSKGNLPWRVGIQHPREPRPMATLPLYDGEAIGSSGDYQRYFELEGVRYSHLLDPRTGQPARSAQGVTVLITPRARAGTLSDALSKPVFIAGAGHWQALAGKLGLTHVLRVDEGGRVSVSRALAERLAWEPGLGADGVVELAGPPP